MYHSVVAHPRRDSEVEMHAFNLNLSPFLHPRGAGGESRQPQSADATLLPETPDTYGARSGQGYVVKVSQCLWPHSALLAPVEA
jgi:hypothetical protein